MKHCFYIRFQEFLLMVFGLNSGERTRLNDTVGQVPRQHCCGVSEQNTKKVLDGIGFLVSFAARSFNFILCLNSPWNPYI